MAARQIVLLKCDVNELSSGWQQSDAKMRLESRSRKKFPDSPLYVEVLQSTLDNQILHGRGCIKISRLDDTGSEQTLETVPVERLCDNTTDKIREHRSSGRRFAPFDYPMSALYGHSFVSLRYWKEGDKNKRRVLELTMSAADVPKIVNYLRRIECVVSEKPTPGSLRGNRATASSAPPTSHVAPQASSQFAQSHIPTPGELQHSQPHDSFLSSMNGPRGLSFGSQNPSARPSQGLSTSISSLHALEQVPYTVLGGGLTLDDHPHRQAAPGLPMTGSFERPASVYSAIRPSDIESLIPQRLPSSGRLDSRGIDSRGIDSRGLSSAGLGSQHGRESIINHDQQLSRPGTTMQVHPDRDLARPASAASHTIGVSQPSSTQNIRPPQLATPAASEQRYQPDPHIHSTSQPSLHHLDTTPRPAEHPSLPPAPHFDSSNTSRDISSIATFFALPASSQQEVHLACQALYDTDKSRRDQATQTLARIQLSSPDFLKLAEGISRVFEANGVSTTLVDGGVGGRKGCGSRGGKAGKKG